MAKNKSKTDQWLKAALEGNLAGVAQHITSGINIETVGQDGRTALMNAAGGHHAEVVRSLLSAKAKTEIKSNNGRDALMYLLAPDWAGLFKHNASSDLVVTLKALLAAGAQISKDHLVTAILTHDTPIIEILVKAGRGVMKQTSSIHAAIAEAKKLRHEQSVDADIFEANIRLLLQK